jgi:hypothetical protein
MDREVDPEGLNEASRYTVPQSGLETRSPACVCLVLPSLNMQVYCCWSSEVHVSTKPEDSGELVSFQLEQVDKSGMHFKSHQKRNTQSVWQIILPGT